MKSLIYSAHKALLALPVLFLLLPSVALGHPHSWIGMETEINVQDEQIQSLTMHWEFDAMTSAYMLAGEDMSSANRAATLDSLAQEVLQNLYSSHYFTYFYQDKTPIRYKAVEHGTLNQRGVKLTLSFELALSKPLNIYTPELNLLIFDPTYFIDMSWEKKHAVTISEPYQARCRIELVEPSPTPAQVAYAMSLGVDDDPDSELGQLFTQKALLACNTELEH